MPELPEVESVKLGLNQLVKGKAIDHVQVDWPRIVGAETLQEVADFSQALQGQTIEEIGRRGKYLIFNLSESVLISHLRMEGKYLHIPASQKATYQPDKHTHVQFHLMDHSILAYHDVRKFGRMEIISKDQVQIYFQAKGLGPEPTAETFDLEKFQQALAKINRAIKPVLLGQKLVVGLGNIYVDEALFAAKIHPGRPASSLQIYETQALHQAILTVLAKAVEAGGSSIRTYRNSLGEAGKFQQQLQVYGRQGQACPQCQKTIEKIQLAQRGTHFCPYCQVLTREGQ